MNIKRLVLGPLSTNCYILEDTDERTCIVIDPAAEAEKILKETVDRGIKIEKILLTHTHFDHFGALSELQEKADAQVCVGRYDRAGLNLPELNLSSLNFFSSNSCLVYNKDVRELSDGDEITAGDIRLLVIEIPGHTPGGVCFISYTESCIFSGDTVFAGSIGRTDFPGGSYSAIIQSMNRVLSYDETYQIFPGHGASTTVAQEKICNPYFIR